MRKTLLLLSLTTMIFATFTSCRKDYSCDCTVTVEVPMFGPSTTTETTALPKSTKKRAENTCEDAEDALKSSAGTNATVTCSLK